MNSNTINTKSFDFDPNISVWDLLQTIEKFNLTFVSLNPQYPLPLPSITVSGTSENLLKFDICTSKL